LPRGPAGGKLWLLRAGDGKEETMQVCPRCGVENRPDRAACWNCFGPLEGGTVEEQQEVAVVHAPRFSLRIPWKPILAVIVVVGGGLAAYKFVMGGSPASVAQSYMGALLVGDTEQIQKWAVGGTGALLPKQLKLDKYELQPPASVQDGTAEMQVMLYLMPDTSMISRGVNLAEHAKTLADAMEALKRPVSTSLMLTKDQGRWKVDEMGTSRRLNVDIQKKLPEGLLDKLAKIPQSPVPTGTTPGTAAPAVPGIGTPSAAPARPPLPAGAPGARAAAPSAGQGGGIRRGLSKKTGLE